LTGKTLVERFREFLKHQMHQYLLAYTGTGHNPELRYMSRRVFQHSDQASIFADVDG
jgi:hypothetical protein